MWTLLSVPREEGPLSTRVRNDDAAMGPLHNTTHESASCTSKSGRGTSSRSSEIWKVSFGPGWLFPKFGKSVSAQGGYLFFGGYFLWCLLLFSRSYFFATLVFRVFRKATFLTLHFLCFSKGYLIFFATLYFFLRFFCPEATFFATFFGDGGGLFWEVVREGCPKVVSRFFSSQVVVGLFFFPASWSECRWSVFFFCWEVLRRMLLVGASFCSGVLRRMLLVAVLSCRGLGVPFVWFRGACR